MLERLCAKVTYLGHSSTPVQVWVEDVPPAPTLVPVEAGAPHYLRVFVRQLRVKLADDPGKPCFIVTEPGLGYRWKPEPDA